MAKVEFTRVETNAEVENIDIKDGRFMVTGEGKAFIDYGENRIGIGGTPDTQMSDSSTNSVENRVIKGYVDNEINDTKDLIPELSNTYGTSNSDGYTQEYINNNNGFNATILWTGTVTGTNQITLNNSYKNYKKLRFWLAEKHNYLEIDTNVLAESDNQSVNHKTIGPVVSFAGSNYINMAALRLYQVSDTKIVINQLPLVVINGSTVSVTVNGINIVEIQGIN